MDTKMTTKQLVNQLYVHMVRDLSVSIEQVELIVLLQQSFETPEEKALRLEKFRQMTTLGA
jgi:hypothetical protein